MTPFLIAVILVLLLVTYFPPITLWFPDLIMKYRTSFRIPFGTTMAFIQDLFRAGRNSLSLIIQTQRP